MPAALAVSLRGWIDRVVRESASRCERALLRCDLARDPDHGPDDADDAEFLAWYTQDELLLDVVDALLDLLPLGKPIGNPAPKMPAGQQLNGLEAVAYGLANMTFIEHRQPLQRLLDDGRSSYTIRPDGRGLVRRVDATVTALVNTAARGAAEQPDRGSASTHLRRAFDAAHALHPDPVRAYSESIKAVESAAHATLEPNNRNATLGTMLGVLRNQRHRLIVVLAGTTGTEGLQTVESMMRLLWTGHTSRHGNLQTTRDETAEEAQMAVFLAASLVQWFSTGAVYRR